LKAATKSTETTKKMFELDTFTNTLKALLRNEIDCVRRLLAQFDDEKVALTSLNDSEISLNSEKKQMLIETLQQASIKRLNWMAQHGLVTTSEGDSRKRVSSPDFDLELESLFDGLYDLASQCEKENRNIGQLINRRSHFLNQTLKSLLTGSEVTELTYQANGQTDHVIKLQPLTTI